MRLLQLFISFLVIGSTTILSAQTFYTQTGEDSTWAYIMADSLIPIGVNSTDGITGSTIDVDNQLIEIGQYADNGIINNLRIHTVGNSSIKRDNFDKWSRWYQEDGNTQVFRLFEGEENVRNERELAARIESFDPSQRWLPEPGVWHEWVGHYTVIKSEGCSEPHNCAIFQAKGNNVDHWSVMLNVDDQGNLWLNRRRGTDSIIATNILGQGFDIKVRDNGFDYEVYLDDNYVGTGEWERTEEIGFRWGIYVGETDVKGDILVFVTGAANDPEGTITNTSQVTPEAQIEVYPNPSATGKYFLNDVYHWCIYSMDGTKIKHGTSSSINLSDQETGTYLLRVDGEVKSKRSILFH